MMEIQAHTMASAGLTIAAVVATLGTSAPAVAKPPGLNPGVVVTTRVEFPVTLADDQEYTLVGHLSTKLGGGCGVFEPRTLQVLLHGGTYDHEYWDAPKIDGVSYSYARYMADRCYSVLALDMLGTGESDKPAGDFVDLEQSSSAVEQVLAQLDDAGGPCLDTFARIVLVGHSIGTITSVYTLGTYGGVADALVATGWAYTPHVIPIDPAAFEEPLSHPYVYLPPEFRAQLFYHPPTSDPDVVAYDNANMAHGVPRALMLDVLDMMTALAIGDPGPITAGSRVDLVDVPVLAQFGEFDPLAPSASVGQEVAFYGASPAVTIQSLPDIGHDFNLHLTRLAGWKQIDAWIAATVGK